MQLPLQVPKHRQRAADSSRGSPCKGPLGWGGQHAGLAARGRSHAGEEVGGTGDVVSLAVSPKLRHTGLLLLAQSSAAPGAARHLQAPTLRASTRCRGGTQPASFSAAPSHSLRM